MNVTPAGDAFKVDGIWYQDYNIFDTDTNQYVVRRYKHNGLDWIPADNELTNTNKSKDNQVNTNESVKTNSAKRDLSKAIHNTESGISLKKNIINLDKVIVDLSKSSGVNIVDHVARVAVVLDISGSMLGNYTSGYMQKTLSRLVPIGLRFDDNGQLDVWLFSGGSFKCDPIDLTNFDNYVNNVILNYRQYFGVTHYAPVIKDIINEYTVKEPSKYPSFVIYITDGENSDAFATNRVIKLSSQYNIYFQFVGMGKSTFKYLEKLDNLSGRPYDNTGFIKVTDFKHLSDEELYRLLIEDYTRWLKEFNG